MTTTHCQHCRQVARQAARCVYIYAAQIHLQSLDDRLLAEARATDRYHLSDADMLPLLRAEYRRIAGASLGGFVAAERRRARARDAL